MVRNSLAYFTPGIHRPHSSKPSQPIFSFYFCTRAGCKKKKYCTYSITLINKKINNCSFVLFGCAVWHFKMFCFVFSTCRSYGIQWLYMFFCRPSPFPHLRHFQPSLLTVFLDRHLHRLFYRIQFIVYE